MELEWTMAHKIGPNVDYRIPSTFLQDPGITLTLSEKRPTRRVTPVISEMK
jgi:hypothetical protein